MPELPEVEAVRQVLEPQLRGQTIQRVQIRRPEVAAHPGPEEFCGRLAGQAIVGMNRRGKFLLLLLERGNWIIIHLRMTGCLLLTSAGMPEEPHTHIVFQLESGRELRFSDTRRFGRLWLLQKGEADRYTGMDKLGLEPFDPALTGAYLSTRLGKHKKPIKACLLDQSVVAGIGNIYADEILFAADIHPARMANSLNRAEWARLAVTIPEQLSFFIDKNRITPEEYQQTKGQDYRNTPFLRVYGHGGEPCPVCGDTLCRTVIGGRSSVFCPGCQPEICHQ